MTEPSLCHIAFAGISFNMFIGQDTLERLYKAPHLHDGAQGVVLNVQVRLE